MAWSLEVGGTGLFGRVKSPYSVHEHQVPNARTNVRILWEFHRLVFRRLFFWSFLGSQEQLLTVDMLTPANHFILTHLAVSYISQFSTTDPLRGNVEQDKCVDHIGLFRSFPGTEKCDLRETRALHSHDGKLKGTLTSYAFPTVARLGLLLARGALSNSTPE